MPPHGQADPSYILRCIRCVAHRILESVGGYAKEAGIVSVTAGLIGAAWDRLKDQRR
jgi:hypothetical protein